MKPTRHLAIATIIAASSLLGSCTIAKIGGKGSMPLMLNNPAAKVQVLNHFTESKMIMFDYTGSFDVSEIIAEVMKNNSNADAVANVTVTLKSDVGTFFMNLITLGLAAARTVEVSGDFVKAPNGLGSLMQEGKLLGESVKGGPLMMTIDEINNSTIIRTENGFAVVAAE